jgi:predicted acyltransferase
MESERLSSLDALRGLAVAAMILVNNPGAWRSIYPVLRHADWHGWTPTDLIFPFFLFAVGVALAFSLSRRSEERNPLSRIYLKVLTRALIIFGLGIFLNLFPNFQPATVRIPGVLQRIAVCYLFASLIFLSGGKKTRLAAVLILLAGYWLAMKFVPVPGYGSGVLDYKGNLAGYLDTRLLAGHLWRPEFDPEGLLSTLPATATVLLGSLAGRLLLSSKTLVRKAAALFGYGVVLTGLGLVLHPYFPINKQLWTSTFVLLSAGIALAILGLFILVMEEFRLKSWAYPFLVLGSNAIAAFLTSSLLTKIMIWIKVSAAGKSQTLYSWIYERAFASWAGPMAGSLAFALCTVLLWIFLLIPLYRHKVYIKI